MHFDTETLVNGIEIQIVVIDWWDHVVCGILKDFTSVVSLHSIPAAVTASSW